MLTTCSFAAEAVRHVRIMKLLILTSAGGMRLAAGKGR